MFVIFIKLLYIKWLWMFNKKKWGNFMLKKLFLLFFLFLGVIFILVSCGIGKDVVIDIKYKVSL